MKVEWFPLVLNMVDSGERTHRSGSRRPADGELIFGACRVVHSVKDKLKILTVRRGSGATLASSTF